MYIYLPIAEMPVNVLALLLLGGVTGVLSGMFGIGGGFLMTPFLMFMGIPPAVAVSTSANQIIAASVSGFLAHWRHGNVDFRMGIFMLIGGVIGSSYGVKLFAFLQELGLVDLLISLLYVTFLGGIGSLMLMESIRTIRINRGSLPRPVTEESSTNGWKSRLPFQHHFPHSEITVSAVLPIAIGIVTGVMVSMMGIGGGFVMIPAMIYMLGMPTSVVIGTSLFQIIFITSNVTILQAVNTQTVDVVLALLLLSGSVIGAQFGTRYGSRLPAEQLRGLLALLVLSVAIKLGVGLLIEPADIYTVSVASVGGSS